MEPYHAISPSPRTAARCCCFLALSPPANMPINCPDCSPFWGCTTKIYDRNDDFFLLPTHLFMISNCVICAVLLSFLLQAVVSINVFIALYVPNFSLTECIGYGFRKDIHTYIHTHICMHFYKCQLVVNVDFEREKLKYFVLSNIKKRHSS